MQQYNKMFRTGEVVLIYFHEKPSLFARIEDIRADSKKGWWRVTLLPLILPLQKITWILDNEQMRGADFTMQQNPVRIERVVAPEENVPREEKEKPPEEQDKGGRIISLFDEE
ncbi:hypothetical protein JXQ31_20005 [candidate division KSB1 bacterium]|nr:hypothetical protein [candidate division KSB1 bacterium]